MFSQYLRTGLYLCFSFLEYLLSRNLELGTMLYKVPILKTFLLRSVTDACCNLVFSTLLSFGRLLSYPTWMWEIVCWDVLPALQLQTWVYEQILLILDPISVYGNCANWPSYLFFWIQLYLSRLHGPVNQLIPSLLKLIELGFCLLRPQGFRLIPGPYLRYVPFYLPRLGFRSNPNPNLPITGSQ